MTTMPELNDTVAEAVARWREYRELCPCAHHRDYLLPCTCKTTDCIAGFVQPAIVKALIEAVTKPCPCLEEQSPWDTCPACHYSVSATRAQIEHTSECEIEGCVGERVPSDWEEIGGGALSGRIQAVSLSFNDGGWLYDRITEAIGWPQMNPDSAALAAVNEAVKRIFGGKP